MSYTSERRAFKRLKDDCTPEAKAEYAAAIASLLGQYNTTLYENRFVVGGAVEVFTCALLRSAGLTCSLYASQEKAGDLLLPGGKQVSVKGSFRGPQAIKLLNQMGGGSRDWTTATLFVISGVGVVYGDPDMVDAKHLQPVADGLTLKRQALLDLMESDKNVLSIDLAKKPPTELTGHSKKASDAVARQILDEMNSSILLRNIAGEL